MTDPRTGDAPTPAADERRGPVARIASRAREIARRREADALVHEADSLGLGDRLAVDRTLLASDRTLMAWVRTSISTITFGFSLYKFLEYAKTESPGGRFKDASPRNVGLFLVLIGTVPLCSALIEHWVRAVRLGRPRRATLKSPAFLTAVAMALRGIFLSAGMLTGVTD